MQFPELNIAGDITGREVSDQSNSDKTPRFEFPAISQKTVTEPLRWIHLRFEISLLISSSESDLQLPERLYPGQSKIGFGTGGEGAGAGGEETVFIVMDIVVVIA